MKTNRPYYSWSQHNLWKSSKRQFYKRYVLGEDGFRLDAWDKGKEFADFKETGNRGDSRDPLLEQVAHDTPELDIIEKELYIDLDDYKLFAKIDSCEMDMTEFYEYKTGKNPWTQKDVNAHKQLDFYALCLYIANGEKHIPKCKLYWIETEEIEFPDGSTELRYTGRVEEFVREITETDIINIGADILNTLQEIENYDFQEIDIDETDAIRYAKLYKLEKKIKSEKDLLGLKIMNDLKNLNTKHGVSEAGKFTLSTRQKKIYPLDIVNKEADYKAEIDELKRVAAESGDIEIQESQSLRFTPSKKYK